MIIYQWVFGLSVWNSNDCIDEDKLDNCPEINHDLLDQLYPVMRNIIAVGIVGAAILDIISYKYRFVAHYLFYYESVIMCMMGTIPNRFYMDINSFFYLSLIMIQLFFMYCGTGRQIIFATVHSAIRIIVIELVLF